VVFVGCRDGGHLVQQSLVHWPPRGRHRTNWHIFADGDATDSLSYQHVAALEQRFNQFDEYVHLYDSKGNIAGKIEEDLDEDEDEILGGNEKRIPETSLEAGDFKAVLWDSDEVEINVIPYFHIDGTSFDTQMEILDKAKTLLKSHTISVVGIEHSPDLSIQELVEFFTAVNYKTFMLGLRQLYRIDNICPEVMENVLDHPTFRRRRRLFSTGKDYQQAPTPPYFVAMPKGRHGFEEMTIQTMYDLFSGSGGGGQVKTANDRKAPGKK
jgi:catechol 2,3-dioxygenase-like lactoylglutathione lyase family enzyme